jgi:hypothetical protein
MTAYYGDYSPTQLAFDPYHAGIGPHVDVPVGGPVAHTTVEAWGRPVWKKNWLLGKWKYAGLKDVQYIPRTAVAPAPVVAAPLPAPLPVAHVDYAVPHTHVAHVDYVGAPHVDYVGASPYGAAAPYAAPAYGAVSPYGAAPAYAGGYPAAGGFPTVGAPAYY